MVWRSRFFMANLIPFEPSRAYIFCKGIELPLFEGGGSLALLKMLGKPPATPASPKPRKRL